MTINLEVGTFTDPTKADTDDNGVNDDDEDFDEDGLTNLEEFEKKTNPYIADTDSDGLSDGDEVKTHGTDPLVADTDGDGLEDGDEIVLGTNPLVQDTDGDGIIDSEEKYQQTFTHKVKNDDCAVTEVIVDMECTGNINRTTSVESVMNVDILCTDVVGLVGEPFEIETKSEFDKATLTFKINKDKLGGISFDNLLFLWYNEEEDEFVELETMLDEANGTASIVTTHFSKYMVVDKKAWFDAWAVELNYNPTGGAPDAPSIPVKYNTVLAIDCSGSMDWNDHITRILNIRKCQRIDAAEGYIDYMHASDETAIVFFSSSARVASAMTSDKEALKKALQGLSDNGGTSFSAALRIAARLIDSVEKITNGANKNRIILLSDGDDNDSASARNAAVKVCKEKNIEVYTVGFGSANDSILQNIADETGGKYYRAYDAKDIVDIFAEIGYMDDFDMTDTDGDGLPDAVEAAGIRLQNGKILHGCDSTNSDTDGDGLLDGEEIDPKPFYSDKEERSLGIFVRRVQGYYFQMYSNPKFADSDNDGVLDDEDAFPSKYNDSMSYIFTKTDAEWFITYEAMLRDFEISGQNGKKVHQIYTVSPEDFRDEWNRMGLNSEGKKQYIIDEVHLIYHGSPQSIAVSSKGKLCAKTSNYGYNPSTDITLADLDSKEINYLNLSCCNNGNLDYNSANGIVGYDDNIALGFLKSDNSINKITAWDGYSKYVGVYLNFFGNDVVFSWESSSGKSNSDNPDNFDKWSQDVNGYKRIPMQQITYCKDADGIIIISPDEKIPNIILPCIK